MTGTAGIGFSLMVIALAVMLVAVPKRRVSSLGFLFLAVTFLYHFVGEVAQALFPNRDQYRKFVDQATVDPWLVIAGAAMLSFTVAYAFTIGRRGARLVDPPHMAGTWPRWTTILAVDVPMWLFATGTQRVTGQTAVYWAGGLASEFLLLLVPLTLFLYLKQAHRPKVATAILIQSLALVLLGQRSFVIGPIVLVAWAASLVGRPLGKRIAVTVIGTVVVLSVVVSTTRVTFGREVFSTGTGVDRAKALIQGVSYVVKPTSSPNSVADDFVYRLDGNAWPGYVLSRQSQIGTAPLGGLRYDAAVSVPSFLYGSKLSQDVRYRDEEARIDSWYSIPGSAAPPYGPDWLPTILGTLLAYLGPWWLLLAAAALGWALAIWDAKAHTEPVTFTRVVVGMGLAGCVLGYEGDLQNVVTRLRGVVLIWLCWRVATWFMRSRTSVQQTSQPALSAPDPRHGRLRPRFSS